MTRDREHWDDADIASLFAQAGGVTTRCPSPELVSASRTGTLPLDVQAAVSAHLEACGVCRMLADALDDDTLTMLQPEESERIVARIRRGIEGTRRRPWTVMQRGLLSAAVLLVAGAAWRIVQQPSGEAPTNRTAAIHVPVLEIASAPILPSDAQGPLAVSQRRPEDRAALLEALIPYREGNYDRAATQFTALVARDRQSAAGHFYLGLSDLMRGQPKRAIDPLSIASRLESPGTADGAEILWYLAVAYYRDGAADRAAAPLQTLCTGGSHRAEPACAALRTLVGPRTLKVTITDTTDAPLAGVLVGEHAMSRPPNLVLFSFTTFSGRTDATGRVEISGETVTMTERLLVRAVKPGYFTSAVRLPASLEMEHHFRLRPWVITTVNQTIRGTTMLDDSCESDIDTCQRFAVTTPRNGRLEVSVTTAVRRDLDLWLEVPGGDIYAPDEKSPLRLEIDAVAGTTYELQVRTFRVQAEPRDFELRIQLK